MPGLQYFPSHRASLLFGQYQVLLLVNVKRGRFVNTLLELLPGSKTVKNPPHSLFVASLAITNIILHVISGT